MPADPRTGAGPPLAYVRDTFLYEELYRIARYLMGEHHVVAELHAWTSAELEAVADQDYAVVQLHYPDTDGPFPYIVFRAGSRYTTDAVPRDFPGVVEVYRVPKPSGIVLRRLRYVAKALARISPVFYERAGVPALVAEVQGWAQTQAGIHDAGAVLGQCMQELASAGSPHDIVEDAIALSNLLGTKFMNCRITGEEFQKASAVLAFFAIHPQPGLLRPAVRGLIDPAAMQQLAGGKPVVFVPPMDLNYYLSHPSAVSPVSFLAARGAARMLRRVGSESAQKCLDARCIVDFHSGMYTALGRYRGALEILQRLKDLGKHVPTLWSDLSFDEAELHRWWVECEEARVNIMAALHEAALPRHARWNVSRPSRMIFQATRLAESTGYDEASKAVLDLGVRMVAPRFVCDLLVAVVSSVTNTRLERSADRMLRVVADLEAALEQSVLAGDPSYLFYAYWLARRLAEQLDRTAMADDMAVRQGGLRDRVGRILGASTLPKA